MTKEKEMVDSILLGVFIFPDLPSIRSNEAESNKKFSSQHIK